jgi:hypothetical protein
MVKHRDYTTVPPGSLREPEGGIRPGTAEWAGGAG